MYRVASKLASSISSASASKKRACSRFICNRNYVAKDINFGVGAQAAMLEGVSEVSEAVKTAMGLGPKVLDLYIHGFTGLLVRVISHNVIVENKVLKGEIEPRGGWPPPHEP
ncbi:hypothetical protein Dsin_018436 [Dipteronia sinensis]|uniref:Uncharacterized protein n=1 Tax=Dipteronia sinensis TaxID=43782 RepID=A0AAE0A5A4_9ROSI|nr:hypothetical protein Dsin_018436 [Dipteronia sinensis]